MITVPISILFLGNIKIMMGGLVKKAGLDYLHPSDAGALLGIFLEAKQNIDANPELLTHFKKIGAKAFAIKA